jgi:class 3 adenylate cyclase
MIFGDADHFSQLTEAQMPSFIRDFMGIVAATAQSYKQSILFQNTWGDGLFFVFHKMYDAGRFALKLADQIAKLDRKASGLPEHLNLRIGLHAGPVYRFKDALTERMNFIGTHVNRTARIEPVTQPGRVYASDAFAALATLEVPGEFGFDYVGRIPLAKNFGHFPMYDMRRL